MPTLNTAQPATVSLTVPNAYLTVDCSSGAVVEVSWVSAGSISGKRTVQNISEDVGPFTDQTVVTLYCRSGTASYSTMGDQAAQAAIQALVSAAGIRLNDTSAAAANAAIINAALAAGGTVNLIGNGICWINDRLLIGSRTKLFLEAGLTLKMADGVAKTMLETTSHASGVDRAVTSITSAGTVATVTITNHGRAVNDWVSLSGSTSQFYNGTFQVETVPTANTYTVRLLDVPAVTTAAGTLLERAAVSDITIGGAGIWDGNDQGRAQAGNKTDQMFVLGYCANVSIDIRAQNGIHRVINHGYINGLTGKGLVYENSIGGLISGGPVFNMDIEMVVGRNSVDDLVGIQGSDYAGYSIGSAGDCINNKIGRIYGNVTSIGNAVKITGASGFTQEIEVGAIEAECAVSDLVQVVNDAGVTGSNTNCRKLRIGSLRHINPVTGSAGVKVSRDAGTPVLENLIIESARVKVPSGVTYHLVYPNNTNCTIQRSKLSNIDLEGATANQLIYVFTQVGDITEAQVSNLRMTNGGTIWNHDAAGSASGQVVQMSNCRLSGCSSAVGFRRNVTVHMHNVELSSTGAAIISSGSAATLTLYGNPVAENTGKFTNLSGSARVIPYSQTIRADGDFITGAIGASFWNTDTTWAGGTGTDKSGQYGYTGAAWTKLYGPA